MIKYFSQQTGEACQSFHPWPLVHTCGGGAVISEMNITVTLSQAGNMKLFVPSLSTQGSNTAKTKHF